MPHTPIPWSHCPSTRRRPADPRGEWPARPEVNVPPPPAKGPFGHTPPPPTLHGMRRTHLETSCPIGRSLARRRHVPVVGGRALLLGRAPERRLTTACTERERERGKQGQTKKSQRQITLSTAPAPAAFLRGARSWRVGMRTWSGTLGRRLALDSSCLPCHAKEEHCPPPRELAGRQRRYKLLLPLLLSHAPPPVVNLHTYLTYLPLPTIHRPTSLRLGSVTPPKRYLTQPGRAAGKHSHPSSPTPYTNNCPPILLLRPCSCIPTFRPPCLTHSLGLV